MNDELKEKLKILVLQKPMNYGQCCQSKAYSQLKEEILKATPLLDDTYTFKTRIFWILNDITDFPKCYVCGKDIKQEVRTLETGYNKSKKWSKDDLNHITCKNKACCLAKHNENIRNTCLEKYGVDNVWKANIIKEKIKQTNLIRYGISQGGNTTLGRAKAKQTWIKKYGVSSPLKNKQILEKCKNTCLEKYGCESFTQTQQYRDLKIRRNLDAFVNKLLSNADPEIEFVDIQNEKKAFNSVHDFWNTKLHMHCKKCGNDFHGYPNSNNFYKFGTYSSCQKCHPSYSSSIYEKQLCNFIVAECNCKDLQCNSRSIIKPFELDAYSDRQKLAFEFDGIYWHSNAVDGTDNFYHLYKTEECEKQGIQLIHIFENEWLSKQDIVKSRIKNLFGIYDKTVFARKCEVREVSSKSSRGFQEINHIQGAVNSKISLGLYFNNELISLMTFGKCRFDKKHEWELLRFCNKLGYHVPGAASRLLKHFEKDYSPKSLVSYADRRWSRGNVYEKLGFKLDHISKPDYWYVCNGKLESRLKYQKHKLKSILKKFDNNKTEVQNMKDNGFYRIFDCGNLVFEKIY